MSQNKDQGNHNMNKIYRCTHMNEKIIQLRATESNQIKDNIKCEWIKLPT
jgi:hypothetical protein